MDDVQKLTAQELIDGTKGRWGLGNAIKCEARIIPLTKVRTGVSNGLRPFLVSPSLKLKRPKVDETMTIAAGFKTWEGIIIWADSEETKGDYAKVSRPKIVVYPKRSALYGEVICQAVFTGSGASRFIDLLVQKLGKIVDQVNPGEDVVTVKDRMEDELINQYSKHWKLYGASDDSRPHVDLLIALWANNAHMLLLASGPQLIEVTADFACIGYGVVLGEYITDRIFKHSLSLVDAKTIALYMLEQVKTYVPNCGKESHTVVLKKDGTVERKDDLNIAGMSNHLSNADTAIQWLFVNALNLDNTKEQTEEVLKTFTDTIWNLREGLKVWREYVAKKRW